MAVAMRCRGFFGGSGSGLMSRPDAIKEVFGLVGKEPSACKVLYLGTATYDIPRFRAVQTDTFAAAGAVVSELRLASESPTQDVIDVAIGAADIIVVSGGNTLFATDRWNKLGVTSALRRAWDCGSCVMAGGSAGAIWVFDSGHSDSADPHYFKKAMLSPEWTSDPSPDKVDKSWEYIRVPSLGILPGLVCPHHDRTQSNGTLRATDFDKMLLRHPGEQGVGIDHWAALVVDGDKYRVYSEPGEGGSVLPDGTLAIDGSGKPGIWIKRVVDGKVHSVVAPIEGNLADLLRPAEEIVEDPRVELCRKANPDDAE